MKIIIAGGGTGGHIFPAIAIANAIQRRFAGAEVLFVGANGKMEMEKVPQAGYKIIGLDIVGFNRSNMLKNISLPFKIWKSRKKAIEIIQSFRPDVAVGVGGFASFPILSAAQAMGIPTLIQEQNSFAGKSNKILGKKAGAICVAYDNMERFFPKSKLIHTGNPVRASIVQSKVTKAQGLEAFQLPSHRKTLLVVGGSLGAQAINEAIDAQLQTLVDAGIQIIWQTGKPYFAKAQQAAQPFSSQVRVCDFIKEMEHAYAAADIVVSRAGAIAIAELCIIGKPVVFVPYPFAAEDHQTSNAMALVQKNAAWMVKNEQVQQELITKLLSLMGDEQTQLSMQQNIKNMAITDADDRIADIVGKLAGKNA